MVSSEQIFTIKIWLIKVMYNFYTDSKTSSVPTTCQQELVSILDSLWTDKWLLKTLFTTRRRKKEEEDIFIIHIFYFANLFFLRRTLLLKTSLQDTGKNWRRPMFKFKEKRKQEIPILSIQWSCVWFSGWPLISDSFWILCFFIELEILCVSK